MALSDREAEALGYLHEAGVDVTKLAHVLLTVDLSPEQRGPVDRTLASALIDLCSSTEPPVTGVDIQPRVDALVAMCGNLATSPDQPQLAVV